MQKATFLLGLALIASVPDRAFALTGDDTMASWTRASDTERARLLDELESKAQKHITVGRAAILDCMNRAAAIGEHGTLSIKDVAEACADASDRDSTET